MSRSTSSIGVCRTAIFWYQPPERLGEECLTALSVRDYAVPVDSFSRRIKQAMREGLMSRILSERQEAPVLTLLSVSAIEYEGDA